MDDLVEWLREQLSIDANWAHAASARERAEGSEWRWDKRAVFADGGDRAVAGHIANVDPARVLREVEAKRRIVDDLARYASDTEAWEAGSPDTDGLAIRTLALLALPYADRPGYRDDWKP